MPDGLLLLDKPSGMSSQDALVAVKRAFGAKKVVHVGMLDPFASGLLLLALGVVARLAGWLGTPDKRYRATVHLRGKAGAPPPSKAALREAASVDVVDVVDVDRDVDSMCAAFEMMAPAGLDFSIWSEDLGRSLGVDSHLIALRRLSVGVWKVEDAVSLEALIADPAAVSRRLVPAHALDLGMPAIAVSWDEVNELSMGRTIAKRRAQLPGPVRLLAPGGQIVGIGSVRPDGRVKITLRL